MDTKKQHTDENNNLTITLLIFNRSTEGTESFYFHYMSTLQATTILRQDRKIVSAEICAYTRDNKYLDEQTQQRFNTIGDFNDFFTSNSDYYIHNCDIELENGLTIGSHDDGEVVIRFFSNSADRLIIDEIFDKYNLDKRHPPLIALLISM